MAELKKASRDIIIGVLATLISTAIIGHFSGWFGGNSAPDKATIKTEALKTLTAYTLALNTPGQTGFDAHRYFAPHIEKYISMDNITPKAINSYIFGKFRSEFKQYNIQPDETTFVIKTIAEDYYETAVIMIYNYEQIPKNKKVVDSRTLVTIRFDKNFKISAFIE